MPITLFQIPRRRPLRRAVLRLALLATLGGLSAQEKSAVSAPLATGSPVVTLPAGGELTRSYASDRITVRLVSRPFFTAAASGAPAIELGPVSLTFVREKNTGALLLLGGSPVTVPVAVPLGEDGRSAQPLDLSLSYDRSGNLAGLVFAGKTTTVATTAATTATGPLGVVVAAGGEQKWTLETFEVTAGAAGSAKAGAPTGADPIQIVPRKISPAVMAANRAKDFADSQALYQTGDSVNAEKALFKSNRWPEDTPGWRLESAGKLIQMALARRQQYDFPGAMAIARRALAILREVNGAKGTKRERSQAHEMAAYIAAEILRDPAAARTEYGEALKISAQSPRARAGVEKLDAEQAKAGRLAANVKPATP